MQQEFGLSRFRCRVCNKQMNDVPTACPDCGAKPREISRTAKLFLTCAFAAAMTLAVVWLRDDYQHSTRRANLELVTSGAATSSASSTDGMPACDQDKLADLHSSIPFLPPCRQLSAASLESSMKGQPFEGHDIDSAIAVSKPRP